MKSKSPAGQRGGFVMGLVAGLLIGLALALGVALYITKAPVPFMNKVPQRTAEQDSAENERNRTWDPNAPLGGKAGQRPAGAAAAAAASAATAGIAAPTVVGGSSAAPPAGIAAANVPTTPRVPTRDPSAILDGAAPAASPAAGRATPPMLDPFVYFVQAGAYTRTEDAEQQRARLAMLGQAARITEREQAGRVVYRVRLGPFTSRDAADTLQNKLQEQSIEAQIVRVEKP
ncbi:MAG TPA: SPOR domain-containing protein [Rubrivivax sp.]|jgi:cell division protein FtsN|nr:SPOR domain-containing protein [Rubrivivax sp.]